MKIPNFITVDRILIPAITFVSSVILFIAFLIIAPFLGLGEDGLYTQGLSEKVSSEEMQIPALTNIEKVQILKDMHSGTESMDEQNQLQIMDILKEDATDELDI